MRMRLAILDSGHGFGTKALFALIRAVSRQPVLGGQTNVCERLRSRRYKAEPRSLL